LDLKDPEHPKVVFAIANGGQAPIPLSSVLIDERTINQRPEDGAIFVPCSASYFLSQPGRGDTTLQPGATITVTMPVGPHCPAIGPVVGFLVYLRGDGRAWNQAEYDAIKARNAQIPEARGPMPSTVEQNALLRKASVTMLSLSQR